MGRLEINMRKLKELNGFSLGKKLTIAIDIDGTIADSSGVDFRRVSRKPDEILKAKPIKGALKAVKRLYKEGHTIVFYTCRNYASKLMTMKWLKKHGFPFHHLEMKKFVAHVYIDDRAINGCSWKRIKESLETLSILIGTVT
ncbi:MAG: hypothetical protein COS99_00155 [Candidatus Omnitrophica bacterium CG07_land_8_20_14_0_80_42_15]|uniref:Phosphoheptose isomerase n=1 Tax=Candidatus Aquitaenariimonas noxiae TaxID=1974741 RepID=A0A2J0KVD1_9BACT|nr:MAG: hypothetical protein COS99_00155 [Candidatus Omnitrophica bacterium CG07_land_8_20_14_0_80_42_15]